MSVSTKSTARALLIPPYFSTVRSKKVAFVQEWYTQYGDKVEIVAIDDLIAGDYSAALKGLFHFDSVSDSCCLTKASTDVEAVIHVAAPIVGRAASHQEQVDVGTISSVPLLR